MGRAKQQQGAVVDVWLNDFKSKECIKNIWKAWPHTQRNKRHKSSSLETQAFRLVRAGSCFTSFTFGGLGAAGSSWSSLSRFLNLALMWFRKGLAPITWESHAWTKASCNRLKTDSFERPAAIVSPGWELLHTLVQRSNPGNQMVWRESNGVKGMEGGCVRSTNHCAEGPFEKRCWVE